MTARLSISPELLIEARRLYEAGQSQVSIAKFLGISCPSLRKYMSVWGWVPRSRQTPVRVKQAIDRIPAAPQESSDCGAFAAERGPDDSQDKSHSRASQDCNGPDIDTRALAHRVETVVRQELSGIEKRLSAVADPAEAERNARVLASLVKSLNELAKLDATKQRIAQGASSEGRSGEHDGVSPDPYDTDLPPRDLAALRAELAVRLERMQEQRRS